VADESLLSHCGLAAIAAERGSSGEHSRRAQLWAAERSRDHGDFRRRTELPFPLVLDVMASNMSWATKPGKAFLAQQQDVLSAVQRERGLAKERWVPFAVSPYRRQFL
jgi:hypothetical protein